jgi:Flp pilus assembly protein TadG
MIVPIMSVMFIGAVELSQAITVDRRVTQVASSTADLVRGRKSRSRRPRSAIL